MQVNCVKNFPGFFTVLMLHGDSETVLYPLGNLLKLYCVTYVIHDVRDYQHFESIDAHHTVLDLYFLEVF